MVSGLTVIDNFGSTHGAVVGDLALGADRAGGWRQCGRGHACAAQLAAVTGRDQARKGLGQDAVADDVYQVAVEPKRDPAAVTLRGMTRPQWMMYNRSRFKEPRTANILKYHVASGRGSLMTLKCHMFMLWSKF